MIHTLKSPPCMLDRKEKYNSITPFIGSVILTCRSNARLQASSFLLFQYLSMVYQSIDPYLGTLDLSWDIGHGEGIPVAIRHSSELAAQQVAVDSERWASRARGDGSGELGALRRRRGLTLSSPPPPPSRGITLCSKLTTGFN